MVVFVLGCCTRAGNAQTLTPFELQALAASLLGKTLTGLTLSGSATWTAGSLKEDGTVSLAINPDGSLKETWTLPTQSHSVTETGFAAGKSCSYTDKAGIQHENTAANCAQPVAWFAPWVTLNLLTTSGLLSATDVTQAADTATGIVKLQFATQLSSGQTDPVIQAQLNELSNRTAVTVSFNQITALPASLSFDYVLDNDPKHVVAYQVVFSDYRLDQGFIVPHHIQRYIQRTLQADITITNVSAN